MRAKKETNVLISRNRSDDNIRRSAIALETYLKDRTLNSYDKIRNKPLLECIVRMCLPTMDRRSIKFAWVLIRHGAIIYEPYARYARNSAYKAAREAFDDQENAASGLKSARYWFNAWNVLADHMELAYRLYAYEGIVIPKNRNAVYNDQPRSNTRNSNFKASKTFDRTKLSTSMLPRGVKSGNAFDSSTKNSVEIFKKLDGTPVEHPWRNTHLPSLFKRGLRLGKNVPKTLVDRMTTARIKTTERPETIVMYADYSATGGRTRQRAKILDAKLKSKAFSADVKVTNDEIPLLKYVLDIYKNRAVLSWWAFVYAWVLLRHGASVDAESPGLARLSGMHAAREAYHWHFLKYGKDDARRTSRFWFVAWYALADHLERVLIRRAEKPGHSGKFPGTRFDISSIDFTLGPLILPGTTSMNSARIHPWKRTTPDGRWSIKFPELDMAFVSLEQNFAQGNAVHLSGKQQQQQRTIVVD